MDEDALRAMMPMGFGKPSKAKAKGPAPSASSSGLGADLSKYESTRRSGAEDEIFSAGPTAPTASSSSRGPVKGPARGPLKRPVPEEEEEEEDEEDDADDGLTVEERRRNLEIGNDGEDGEESDSDGEVDFGPEPEDGVHGELPVSHEVVLSSHTKTISALAVDPSGARIATGSYDYDVKLWDFGGMDSNFRPFKTWEPAGSYFVRDTKWSTNGDSLLVISGTAQPKLYDRDGGELATYRKGDVYIHDMKTTSGHVAELTGGAWHPHERQTFMTASADSTLRLWDVDDKRKQKQVIVVKSKERGTRTKVTAAAYSPDGKTIGAAGLDGALHLWSTSSNYARPSYTLEGAHVKNTETSGITFSMDNHTFATRGGDDTVKLWDMRAFKKPLAERSDLPNLNAETNVIFSLDERTLLTGCAAKRGAEMGRVHVLSRQDLSTERAIGISQSSVVKVAWQPKINQLFTGSADGSVHVFYSPTASSRGALLCVGKARRARAVDDLDMQFDPTRMPIITPHAPEAGDQRQSQAAKKRKYEKMRADPRATRMPERPMQGPGKGGRIGAAATQHVVQSMWKDNSRSEDPREALLKYADKGDSDPQWTAAWSKTQPKPVFAEEREDEDGEDGGEGEGEGGK